MKEIIEQTIAQEKRTIDFLMKRIAKHREYAKKHIDNCEKAIKKSNDNIEHLIRQMGGVTK